jgi:hypothetical protein
MSESREVKKNAKFAPEMKMFALADDGAWNAMR